MFIALGQGLTDKSRGVVNRPILQLGRAWGQVSGGSLCWKNEVIEI